MATMQNQHPAAHQQHRRVYFVTAPRTASNLFVRILNLPGQPDARAGEHYGGYFFMKAMRHRDSYQNWQVPATDLPSEQIDSVGHAYQDDMTKYREFLEQTDSEGKIVFVKEHAHLMAKPSLINDLIHDLPLGTSPDTWPVDYDKATDARTPANPTIVPDNVLQTFRPTFLIRHPALQIPSLYRARVESQNSADSESSNSFAKAMYNIVILRRLYDFYVHYFAETDPSSPFPLVIDAADLITHPATIMKHYCELTGLDVHSCKFNWDATSSQQLDQTGLKKADQRFLSTIMASTGVLAEKAGLDVDVDTEAHKWRNEFGDKIGAFLEGYVRAAMPDYLYLKAKRWIPDGHSEQDIVDDIKKAQAKASQNGA